MSIRKATTDDLIRVLTLDRPGDVEELKLMAAEVDNDTGRSVYKAIYEGAETVSDMARKLDISMQLVTYHLEKLLMANLIEERRDGNWLSQKGKRVTHYVPSSAAVIIAPSLEGLRKEGEERVRIAFGSIVKKLFYSTVIGVASFLALNRGIAALYYSLVRPITTAPTTHVTTVSGSGFTVSGTLNYIFGGSTINGTSLPSVPPPLPLLLVVIIPLAVGIAVAYLSFRWFSRRPERKGRVSAPST